MGLFSLKIFSSTRRSLYARSLRKDIAHLSSMSRSIWHLIHGSMKNGAGGVANRSFVRANSITILECTFPEENVSGAWRGKTRPSVARLA